jgi:phospholipase C
VIHKATLNRVVVAAVLLAFFGAGSTPVTAAPKSGPPTKTPIKHFITLMQENHSFDNYFGTYPGADGIPDGTCMPVNPDDPSVTACIDPFHLGNRAVEDLDHTKNTHEQQFRNGEMNGFVWAFGQQGKDGTLAMGHYDGRDLPYYWNIADEYVLFDRFFSSAGGGSVRNHMYWVSGQAGTTGNKDSIPKSGWGDIPTIFDRLQEAGISWKFYVQNYDPTITYRNRGTGDRGSQVVWVPLLNYARYLDDPEFFSHIVNLDEYFTDLQNGTLPAVSYIVPSGASEHPPGSILAGHRFVKALHVALMQRSAWDSSAFQWTYDDWGGWYDHVPPPVVDEYGYGFRVPSLLISAYAKRGYIDSTELDFTSVLKFIEENWDLEPLAVRDANAKSFMDAFDFSRPPREPRIVASTRGDAIAKGPRRLAIFASYGFALIAPPILILGALATPSLRRRKTRRARA